MMAANDNLTHEDEALMALAFQTIVRMQCHSQHSSCQLKNNGVCPIIQTALSRPKSK